MNLFGMGGPEIIVIMVVALIIFGPGKLPEIGAQVGKAVRDFRRATNDLTREFNDSTSDLRSTMDEMKGAVTQVERETKELAQSIPASIEGAVAPSKSNGSTGSASAASPAADSAASAEPVATAVPTKDDPLADLESLDDEVFAEPTRTAS
jgi:sec-independent protein translocase protein TatB